MDFGHSAATDQFADLVPPAQQTSCTVHFLPSLFWSWPPALPAVMLGRAGMDESSEGAISEVVPVLLVALT
jgi:hypothetical protein